MSRGPRASDRGDRFLGRGQRLGDIGELQRGESTSTKRVARTLLEQYGNRLERLIDRGKAYGELPAALDTQAAATLFIGTIQGLVMQSLMAGDVERVRRDAPRVFEIYQRGIRSAS